MLLPRIVILFCVWGTSALRPEDGLKPKSKPVQRSNRMQGISLRPETVTYVQLLHVDDRTVSVISEYAITPEYAKESISFACPSRLVIFF